MPPAAAGQETIDPSLINDPTLAAPAQSDLDRKVGELFLKFTRWKTRMAAEHFTAYLTTYSSLLAGVTGFLFGLLAYRLSDPMAIYRLVKRRTLQLATAIGASLGILTALGQVPTNSGSRVLLLLLATAVGAVSALASSWFSFQFMRHRRIQAAQRDGRRLTDRMRQA